jgi:hypothetical protein
MGANAHAITRLIFSGVDFRSPFAIVPKAQDFAKDDQSRRLPRAGSKLVKRLQPIGGVVA